MRPRRCIGRKVFYAVFAAGYLPALLLVAYVTLWQYGGGMLNRHSPQWSRPYLASLGLIGEERCWFVSGGDCIQCDIWGPAYIPERPNIHSSFGHMITETPWCLHGKQRVTFCYDPLSGRTDKLTIAMMREKDWIASCSFPSEFSLTATGLFQQGRPAGTWTIRDEAQVTLGSVIVDQKPFVFHWQEKAETAMEQAIHNVFEEEFRHTLDSVTPRISFSSIRQQVNVSHQHGVPTLMPRNGWNASNATPPKGWRAHARNP